MRLNDEDVLDPLHLEVADLSSGRRFFKEAPIGSVDEEALGLTGSLPESRGILSLPEATSLEEPIEGNVGPASTYARCLNRHATEPVMKPSVVWVPVSRMSRGSFDVLQKFEGTVLSVQADSFIARLLDKTHSGPDEEAEFPLDEITPGDRELVKPGSVFYWVIGYRREAHGQVSRSSVIRFQRVPSWSQIDIDRAKKAAKTFLSFLDLDRANNTA